MSIRVVTDSTADLPREIVERHRIAVVPLLVAFDDEMLRDGVDITPEQFYERLERASTLPTTSQPSPGAFREVYERLAAEGATDILSIHLGGKLSGTIEAARQGARDLDVRVLHIDSGLASLALGLGVIAAAQAAERGCTAAQVRDLVLDQFCRTHVYFIVDTLEYLRRGGRIGRASELLGTLLRVKPILSFKDGEVVAVARVRTRSRAIEEALRRASALRPLEQLMAVHACNTEDLARVEGRLRELAPGTPLVTGTLGAVLGVHGGPGLVGFAVVSAPPETPSPPGER